MNYVELIEDAITFIENNLKTKITLSRLSSEFGLSQYYFSRIFKALTHKNLREYLNRRKISSTTKMLDDNRYRIIDVAMEYGYESHEAFTRQFLKTTGVTPSQYRKEKTGFYEPVMKLTKRDFINYKGKVIPHCQITICETEDIQGISFTFNPQKPDDIRFSHKTVKGFSDQYISSPNQFLYNLVKEGSCNERILYFSGIGPFTEPKEDLEVFTLPSSSYAVFQYNGSMKEIFSTIIIDICRFLSVSGLEIRKTSVELFERYDPDYYKSGIFSIYVPILS